MTILIQRPAAKRLAATVLSLSLTGAPLAYAQQGGTSAASGAAPLRGELGQVAPGLKRYRQEALLGNLWRRPDLSPRDRSVVTVAALIARNQTAEMPHHLDLALENGVRPGELSEVITHLAFYSGWGNAMAAVAARRIMSFSPPVGCMGVRRPQPRRLSKTPRTTGTAEKAFGQPA